MKSLFAIFMIMLFTMVSCQKKHGCRGIKAHPNYNHKTFKK